MSKFIIKLSTLILLLCVVFNTVNAQEQTAYEKKVLEVKKKYIKKILILSGDWSNRNEAELHYAGEDYVDAALSMGIMGLAVYPNQVEEIINGLKRDLKAAEKLKTAIDIQREKERKLEAEKEAHEKTDIGSIQKGIRTAFEEWNQKEEFEKEADFKLRLKEKSKDAFAEICIEQIKTKIKKYNNSYSITKKLSTYDSESEFFIVLFKTNNIEWQGKIAVPIEKAEEFKANWYNFKLNVDIYDWCFVEKSLCPKLVVLSYNDTKHELILPLENQRDISFSFDFFGINNTHLKGTVFKYSDAKIMEQQVFLSYTNKLDSIFKYYNNKLLQNTFNTDKSVMTDYKKMQKEGSVMDNYKSCLKDIEVSFEKLNNSFEKKMMSQNPVEYCNIYYTQYPNKKVEADKMYIECWCRYDKRTEFDLRFIKDNLNSCNCREQEYRQSGTLFSSKTEFDNFYNKGNDVLQAEIAVREFKKQSSDIESLNFKDLNKSGAARALLSNLSGLNVNQNIDLEKKYVARIASYKEKTYYIKIVEFVVDTNSGLSKEWARNGGFFNDKIEFYEAFISADYKKILKSKK